LPNRRSSVPKKEIDDSHVHEMHAVMSPYGGGTWYVVCDPNGPKDQFGHPQNRRLEGPPLVRYLARTGKQPPSFFGRGLNGKFTSYVYDPETGYSFVRTFETAPRAPRCVGNSGARI
jgi:hypothetical protein